MLNPFPLPCTGAKVVNKELNADSLGERRLAETGKTAVSLLPPDKEAPVLEKQKLNRRKNSCRNKQSKSPYKLQNDDNSFNKLSKQGKPIGSSPQKN
jgi:hypothetical protein